MLIMAFVKLGEAVIMRAYMIAVLTSVLLLSGCGFFALRVSLRSQQDPAYAPSKSDPIALVLPDNPSIQDRQIDPAFRRQLIRSGFTLVEPTQAKWVIGISTRETTYFSGMKTAAFAIGGGSTAAGFGSSQAEYTSDITIYCWLFPAKEFLEGKRVAIWMATETTSSDDFWANIDTLAHGLIETYGTNSYDNSAHIRKIKTADKQK